MPRGKEVTAEQIIGKLREAEVELVRGKTVPAGMLIIDDYLWNLDESSLDRPQLAIDLFLPLVAHRAEQLHHDHQVIVRKR